MTAELGDAKQARTPDLDVIKTLGIGRSARFGRPARRVLGWGVALALAGAGVGAIVHFRRPAAPPVFVSSVVARGDIRVTVTATGSVEALKQVEVGAEVSGRVVELPVDFNDHVHVGQVLAVIDPEQLKAAEDQSRAQVLAALAAVRQATATAVEQRQAVARTRSLADQQLVARQSLEGAQAAVDRAEAALSNARANATLAEAALAQAQSHREKSTIRSPIDGIVLARLVEPGQTVTAGFTTPILFRIAEDLTRMRLKVDVDEADVGRVREGQAATFTVDAYPERTFPSQVVALRNDPKVAQNVVTYEAVMTVDNKQLLLKPGMTATSTIETDLRRGVVLVPNTAVRFAPPGAVVAPAKPGWKSVWVLRGAPGRAGAATPIEVPVRLGASDGSNTELLEGALVVGDQIVSDVKDAT